VLRSAQLLGNAHISPNFFGIFVAGRLNGQTRVDCRRRLSVRCMSSRHILKTKQDRPTVTMDTIQKLAPLILLPHSDPPPYAPWATADSHILGKHGCGPAFYHTGDILIIITFARTTGVCAKLSIYPVLPDMKQFRD